MIAIIRDHEDGDFAWESRRLSRVVTLSARAGAEQWLSRFPLALRAGLAFDDTATPAGSKSNAKLTSSPDHPVGAGHTR
jgi:hypothetical protein